MPAPTSALTTQRPDLAGSFEEFPLRANRAGFIGLKAYPAIAVASEVGQFGRIPVEELLRKRNTLRAPGSGYSRGDWDFEPVTFACSEHGHEEPVDERESAIYRDWFDAELVSTEIALDTVLRAHEERVCDSLTDTSVYTGAYATAVSTAWNVPGSATPIDDVRSAKATIYNRSGMVANAVICSWSRFLGLMDNAQITNRVDFNGLRDPKSLAGMEQVKAAIAQALGVEMLLVAGGLENTANQGATPSISSLWPDTNVQVCVVGRTNSIKEPCVGRTFHFDEDGSQLGGTVETYEEPQTRSEIVRARMTSDENRIYFELGQLLTST